MHVVMGKALTDIEQLLDRHLNEGVHRPDGGRKSEAYNGDLVSFLDALTHILMYVCVSVCARERECVCVCESVSESLCKCVCERERVCVCVN